MANPKHNADFLFCRCTACIKALRDVARRAANNPAVVPFGKSPVSPKRKFIVMEWVKCSDRMPDEGQSVLVWIGNEMLRPWVGEEPAISHLRKPLSSIEKEEGTLYVWHDRGTTCCDDISYLEGVTHWMSLPDCPIIEKER